MIDRARADVYGDETRLWSPLRFAEEEVKHQENAAPCSRPVPGRLRGDLPPGPRREGSPRSCQRLAAHGPAAHQHDRMVHPTPTPNTSTTALSSTSCSGTSSASTGSTSHVTPASTASSSTRSPARSATTTEEQAIDQLLRTGRRRWTPRPADRARRRRAGAGLRPRLHRRRARRDPHHQRRPAGPSSSPGSNTPTSSGSSSSSTTGTAKIAAEAQALAA